MHDGRIIPCGGINTHMAINMYVLMYLYTYVFGYTDFWLYLVSIHTYVTSRYYYDIFLVEISSVSYILIRKRIFGWNLISRT